MVTFTWVYYLFTLDGEYNRRKQKYQYNSKLKKIIKFKQNLKKIFKTQYKIYFKVHVQ